jgi:Septum formation
MAGTLGYSDAADSDMAPGEETADLATALVALEGERSAAGEPTEKRASESRGPVLRGATARQVLLTVLVGLLVGGVVAVLELRANNVQPQAHAGKDVRVNVVFNNADRGTCLNWPKGAPDQPSFVQCTDDHMFEVAESVDTNNVQARCDVAVRSYLGSHYDPNSKFTVGVLWSGDAAGTQSGQRHLLCGLQLLGLDNQPIPFKGQVADVDQSKVWPPGTCLGIDSTTSQPTDIPVDCEAPHAVEVTGAVSLAEKFPGPPPATAAQDAFIREACTRTTEAYLSPIPLRSTGLTVNYSTVSAASWSAGSQQVSCGVGAMRGNLGWATLIGRAKAGLSVNGQAPQAPPSSPEPRPIAPDERLDTQPTAVDTPSPVSTQPRQAPPTTARSTPSPTATPTTMATPTLGPPPGPPPGAILEPTPEAPPGQVIEIPGLAPITLPVWPPPPPPPPPPPA